jgi:hypothetical protein
LNWLVLLKNKLLYHFRLSMLILLISTSLELFKDNINDNSKRKIIKTKATTPPTCDAATVANLQGCKTAFDNLAILIDEDYVSTKKNKIIAKRKSGIIRKKSPEGETLLGAITTFLRECPLTSCKAGEGGTGGCKAIFETPIDEEDPGTSLNNFINLCKPEDTQDEDVEGDSISNSLNEATPDPGDNDNPQGGEKPSKGFENFNIKRSGMIIILLHFFMTLYFTG